MSEGYGSGMILASSGIRKIGVSEAAAALRFGEAPMVRGASAGRRLLWLGSEAAFELTFWCGTCPILFQRWKERQAFCRLPNLKVGSAGA